MSSTIATPAVLDWFISNKNYLDQNFASRKELISEPKEWPNKVSWKMEKIISIKNITKNGIITSSSATETIKKNLVCRYEWAGNEKIAINSNAHFILTDWLNYTLNDGRHAAGPAIPWRIFMTRNSNFKILQMESAHYCMVSIRWWNWFCWY